MTTADTDADGTTRPSETSVGLWAVTIVLALIYIIAGVPKLGALDFIHRRFSEVWGYPLWFEYLIGALEFVGGILLIIPSTAFWAASMLSVIMVGAIYTHLALGNPAFTPVPLICLALLVYVASKRVPGQGGDKI
jgi:uncharacterized membrane protein YphA (DoxX/SURF4 family)